MSFGDISATRGNQRGVDWGSGDITAQLKASLAQFQVSCHTTTIFTNLALCNTQCTQKGCLIAKERVTEMRRRKVAQAEKTQ